MMKMNSACATCVITAVLSTPLFAQSGSGVTPAPGGCRTIVLPETAACAAGGGNCGASIRVPPGGFRPVEYHPPPGVTRVGLEFWFHVMPWAAPAGTQYILTYLNEPFRWSRRLFHHWNGDPKDQGVPTMFPMSIFLHPENGEWLTIGWLNNTNQWWDAYFAITIRECY